MATVKKTTRKTTQKTANKSSRKPSPKAEARETPQAKAERLSRSLSESAQQIWLAGVGAFGRAQAEGTKLFEGLVKEGQTLEQHARKFAGGQAEVVREAVESKVGRAREQAAHTWDRLEKVFEERVHKALVKLDVPGRRDVADLSRRVDGLANELRRTPVKPVKKAAAAKVPPVATKKAAARKSVPGSAAAKTSSKVQSAQKQAAKKVGRKAPAAKARSAK